MTRVSVITAFLDEASNLPVLRQRILKVAQDLDAELEVVLVDDHSADAGPAIAKEWARDDSRITFLRLSRNCGSHAAYSAGMTVATGDCAVLLAADLQDPPEVIPLLLGKWSEGHDVVWAVRAGRRGESWTTRFFSAVYYQLMRRWALPEMPAKGADFLLLDRKVIDAYNAIPEKNTSFLAMILWMGFRQTSIEYVKQARRDGNSKWTLAKKLKLLIDSVISFSYVPIRWISMLGFMMALCGFIYAMVVIIGRLTGWVTAGTGFAALMTVLLVGQGTIMMMLGMLGEYLWRTFDEARGRPRYLVEERFRLGGDTDLLEQANGREERQADQVRGGPASSNGKIAVSDETAIDQP